MIEYLLGSPKGDSLDEAISELSPSSWREPFGDLAMDFVGTLSRRILIDPIFRNFPEMMAMAHWFRYMQLNLLRAEYASRFCGKASLAMPRGLIFHIAPANVDSVFIYTWLLALLTGNANVVKVSQRRTVQMGYFFKVVNSIFEQEAFAPLACQNLVISYGHDDAVTELISSRCQLRVIWGGDATIRKVRSIPLPPLSLEIAFGDRFSLALIKSSSISALDKTALADLVQKFYNDSFWFDQQACSSPRAVIWIGNSCENERSRDRFWSAFTDHILGKKPDYQPMQTLSRTTALFRIASQNIYSQRETAIGALPTRISVDTLLPEDRIAHEGNGLFIEIERETFCEAARLLNSKDQTLIHFGIQQEDWDGFLAELPPHAGDRIVPIGQALAFSSVWDGISFFSVFTREAQLIR